MNWSNIIFVVLIAGLVLFFLYKKGIILANFEKVDPKEAYQMIKKEKDIYILDVRTPAEVKTDGKIPKSHLIPLYELPKKVDKIPKNKKILVYCRSGNRSISASRLLSSLGYKVYNINGGIIEWKKEGLPISKK
ncbi:rhodanese-like domain-containing protein [Hydrogenothermus marinus]|uniref:Rhodanese-related sulfurtransferase n=1 Tax=Hydrogenothermus marinus TaxID=133270 RepID=A0A3M0BMZ7_9AQUI|nr:rhodanese-like domain-containing protein [Hydrogenothermus marinus]RMA97844.1 rhodanese-related sulfurtransferase [Hydrogenothermus marinus]